MADHGDRRRYQQHLRDGDEPCAPCREAERRNKAAYRARRYLTRNAPRRVDPTGTRRRLQALAAIGWPAALIAEIAGCTRSNVSKWAKQDHVYVTTHQLVCRVYDELSMTPGPSAVTRRIARQQGWLAPLCWDDGSIDDPAATPSTEPVTPVLDEVAIRRAMRGDRTVVLTKPERREVVRLLTDAGRGADDIAELLGTTSRTVVRDRGELAEAKAG